MVLNLGTTVHWSSAARTHVGKVRRLNEDALLNRPDLGLWAVADGMGGHRAGDKASQMIVYALNLLSPPTSLEDFVEAAKHQILAVNERLHEDARNGRGGLSGSTVVALLAHQQRGAALWAGDSRVYLFRRDRLHRLTRDHTQVEEWVNSGVLNRQEASNHPASNVITRAVGATDYLELDTITIDVLPGDVYLLCSDGLYNAVGEETIAGALNEAECEPAVERLLNAALQGGAEDNISLVIARAGPGRSDATKTVINPVLVKRGQPPER